MARQQSSTDFAGDLAALLTPSAPHASPRPVRASRNEQSSGLFDVGVLYAAALDEVARRAQAHPQLASLARAAQPTWPRAMQWPAPVAAFDLDAVVDANDIFDDEIFDTTRGRGLGWFGIAVAWLATLTMGLGIATQLPAHTTVHWYGRATAVIAGAARAVPALRPAIAPAAPSPTAPVSPIDTPSASLAPSLALAAPLAPALPAAPLAHAAHVAEVRPGAAPKNAMPKTAGPPRAHAHHVAPAAVALTAAEPPAPVVAPARAPAPAVAPASTAGMSLDDLIRHEVQAESGKHR
jgi:hypothetical protein